jgi:hypothetical protein
MADNTDKTSNDSRTHGQKIRDSLIKQYGKDYYSNLGKIGGKKSDNRPFRDNPGAAKRAVNERWRRYREAKAAEANSKK